MSQIPFYIANNFIEWGLREGVSITPLKLQKLLYLYYARHCYLQNAAPFSDRFVKWPYGPVLEEVYEKFKQFKGQPFNARQPDAQGRITKAHPEEEPFRSIFEEVLRCYGRCSASELVKVTHNGLPNAPHATAWDAAGSMGNCLSLEAIKEDGRRLFAGRV